MLVDYRLLVKFLKENKVLSNKGELIEIGSFLGGDTKILAQYANKFEKKVYAIDVFNINFDKTINLSGNKMSDLYSIHFGGMPENQWEIFENNISDLKNIIVIKEDSKKVILPSNTQFCFGFIDGNHDSTYVYSDFNLIWSNLISEGALAFHDYNGDLPNVTDSINEIVLKYNDEIKKIDFIPDQFIIILTKK